MDPKMTKKTIGFIGLGVMGAPMARHLAAAGHDVRVYNRTTAKAEAFVSAHGGTLALTPVAAADNADVVLSCVGNDDDLRAVTFGAGGAFGGMAKGALFIDHSTVSAAVSRELAAEADAAGFAFVDAPVSGGAQGARDASLAIMVGAEADTLERVRPLLQVMGKRIVHVGPPGAGQVAKACNQMIMVAATQACAEALRLANAHGLDLTALRSALMAGSAGSRVLELMGTKMAERDFGAGIEARLHHKDFAIVMDEASALGVPLPVAAQVWQQLNALMGAGWGREDTSSLLRVLER